MPGSSTFGTSGALHAWPIQHSANPCLLGSVSRLVWTEKAQSSEVQVLNFPWELQIDPTRGSLPERWVTAGPCVSDPLRPEQLVTVGNACGRTLLRTLWGGEVAGRASLRVSAGGRSPVEGIYCGTCQ